LVEEWEVCFHLWTEKVHSSVLFSCGGNEMILLKCSNVVFRDPIVDVESLGKLVCVKGLFSEEADDPPSIDTSSRASEHIP